MFKQRIINFVKALHFKTKDKDIIFRLVTELFNLEEHRELLQMDFDHCFNRAKFLSIEASHETWDDAVGAMSRSRIALVSCELKIRETKLKLKELIKE